MKVNNSNKLTVKQKAQIIREVEDECGLGMMDVKKCCEWAGWDKDLAVKKAQYWPYEWPRIALVDFKGVFRYFTDNFEIEIFSDDGKTFDVNYPRYDILGNDGKYIYFTKMNYHQLSMLIFAYDRQELECFKASLERWRQKMIEYQCSKCVFLRTECEIGIKDTLDCEMFREPKGISVMEEMGDRLDELLKTAKEKGISDKAIEEYLNKDAAVLGYWGGNQ